MNTKVAIVSLAFTFGVIGAKAQQFWSPVSGAPVSISDPAYRIGETYVGTDPNQISGLNTDVNLQVIQECALSGSEFQLSRLSFSGETSCAFNNPDPYMRVRDWSSENSFKNKLVFTQSGHLGIGNEIPEAVPVSLYIRKGLNPGQSNYEAIRAHSISTDGEERILRAHTRLSASAYNFMTKDGDFGFIFSDDGGAFNQNAGFVIAPHIDGEGGLRVDNIGRVNIGKWYEPSGTGGFEYELSVKGGILTEEIKVALWSDWPDYVFAEEYELRSVEELEAFISENRHLPGMPSAREVEDNKGVELGEMNRLLLEKVEELTLYLLEVNKKNNLLEARLDQLENK